MAILKPSYPLPAKPTSAWAVTKARSLWISVVRLTSASTSKAFPSMASKDPLDQKVVGELVYQLIQLNRSQIWSDALAEYGWGGA